MWSVHTHTSGRVQNNNNNNKQQTTNNTQHTTHNTQHTTHNTQHTTHNTQQPQQPPQRRFGSQVLLFCVTFLSKPLTGAMESHGERAGAAARRRGRRLRAWHRHVRTTVARSCHFPRCSGLWNRPWAFQLLVVVVVVEVFKIFPRTEFNCCCRR